MKKCTTCGNEAHDFSKEEVMDCVPPLDVYQFGQYTIDRKYRMALYQNFPFYTAEEVVGSCLGYNPNFPSQEEWLEENE